MSLKEQRYKERPLIVLFIAGLGNGGAERVFINLYQELSGRGYRVRLLAATRKGALVGRVQGVEFLDARFALLSLFRYRAYIAKYRPSVVVATLSSSIFVAAAAKFLFKGELSTPTLICRIANIYQKPTGLFDRMHIYMQRYALLQADAMVANSLSTLHSICSVVDQNLKTIPTRVIYNPVLPNNFDEVRSRLIQVHQILKSDRDKSVHIVVIGRLVHQKRIDHAIKAFAIIEGRHENSRLTIVGDGPLKSELVRLACDLQLERKIEFIPFSSDVPKLLASADCMLSVSRYEGFGNVFIEGLAYCSNLVAYKNPGGSSEILPMTNAKLARDGDIEALAKLALEGIENPPNQVLTTNSYLKNFTITEVSSQYLEFIEAQLKVR